MDETLLRDIVDFAVNEERKAAGLYRRYSTAVASPGTRKLLEEMAAMEEEHEKKLAAFLRTGAERFARLGTVPDLRISDFLVQMEIKEDTPVEDVFIYAMKAEQKAYELYSKLAALDEDPEAVRLFESLAAEEKKHKLDLETEYDNVALRED
jgi:rubrerythrin